jgi:hypothetical protein
MEVTHVRREDQAIEVRNSPGPNPEMTLYAPVRYVCKNSMANTKFAPAFPNVDVMARRAKKAAK